MEKYVTTHQYLYELFSKAYANVFILKEIEHHNEIISEGNKALMQASTDVMRYFTELVKADMALTIFKIGIDRDKKGTLNNLYRLRENAIAAFPNIEVPFVSVSKELKCVEEKIRRIRNSFLAHDEAERENNSIRIEDMEKLLERYYRIFSELTFIEKSDDIKEFTKSSIEGIHANMSMGLGFILQKAYWYLEK